MGKQLTESQCLVLPVFHCNISIFLCTQLRGIHPPFFISSKPGLFLTTRESIHTLVLQMRTLGPENCATPLHSQVTWWKKTGVPVFHTRSPSSISCGPVALPSRLEMDDHTVRFRKYSADAWYTAWYSEAECSLVYKYGISQIKPTPKFFTKSDFRTLCGWLVGWLDFWLVEQSKALRLTGNYRSIRASRQTPLTHVNDADTYSPLAP